MRLEGDFYTVTKREQAQADTFVVEVVLHPEHPIYAGHFPERAVVPGVCMLTVIRECLAGLLGRPVAFAAIKECKYVSALLPEKDLKIRLSLSLLPDNQLKGSVIRCDNGQTVIKLKADLRQLTAPDGNFATGYGDGVTAD